MHILKRWKQDIKKIYMQPCLWKSAQSCLIVCHPLDCTVHVIFQVRKLEWVAVPFSRRFSQSRNWSEVSCIAGGFFSSWATREAQVYHTIIHSSQGKNQVSINEWIHIKDVYSKYTYTHTEWDVFHPWERRKSCHFWQHGWALRALC